MQLLTKRIFLSALSVTLCFLTLNSYAASWTDKSLNVWQDFQQYLLNDKSGVLLDGLTAKAVKFQLPGSVMTIDGVDVDRYQTSKTEATGRMQLAKMHLIRAKSKNKAAAMDMNVTDLGIDYGSHSKNGIPYGRAHLSADSIAFKFADGSSALLTAPDFDHVLSQDKKGATSMLHIKMQDFARSGEDIGPVRADLNVKNLNKVALAKFIDVLDTQFRSKQKNGAPNHVAFEAALRRLIQTGVKVNLSHFTFTSSDGSMSVRGNWNFPAASRRAKSANWEQLLRKSNIQADLEISKHLLEDNVIRYLHENNGHIEGLMKSSNNKKYKALTPEQAKGLIILWERMGLLAIKDNSYILHCDYSKGRWMINGRLFVSPKTSWLPNKIFSQSIRNFTAKHRA